ncbi:effector-associated domain EAD1-containing protein [Streptomyces sp. NPDC006739]|uniref:effector-associated domain EAD1-containing protein n=1 Tax=Streptomyces sp. NPDC006739 TaxID=3364763 RepID=UPI0036AC8B75
MASAEFLSGPPEPKATGHAAQPEIAITQADLYRLQDELAKIYRNDKEAAGILDRIGFPRGRRPNFVGAKPDDTWAEIFVDLANGVVASPYRQLLTVSVGVYRANSTLVDLAQRYGILPPAAAAAPPVQAPAPQAVPRPDAAPAPVAAAAPQTERTCHVIVRADSEDDRRAAAGALNRLGLRPREVWSTAHAVSFRVDSDQPDVVRDGLRETLFGWTVVAPGQPDYLLHQLFVEGPDGRQFRLVDAPAQQHNSDVAAEVIDQYGRGFADATRTTVIDHVQGDGQGRRLDPDATLHDSGVRDGDRMRVGFETTAGAVNPLDRQDALYRVRNQIVAYAEGHPGFRVSADSALLPTEFEVEFEQPSFGPPAVPGGEPTEVTRHVVLIQLGPEFPETAPEVYWLTPVFHPNVYPNYDCEQSRAYAQSKGLVCLGLLAESYQPSLSFETLCQMLVDMAGFRNYSLFEPTGELGPDGTPRIRGNFYDRTAAQWVDEHQDRVRAISGSVVAPAPRDTPRYPNLVEPLDGP